MVTDPIPRPLSYTVVVLIFVLLVLDIFLIRQNRNLKYTASQPRPESLPTIGSSFPVLDGFALDGSHLSVALRGQRQNTLVLVFTEGCAVCGANWPAWRRILSTAPKRNEVIFANVGSRLDNEFVVQHLMKNWIVFDEIDPREQLQYNLRLVPETILVSTDARIENVWFGPLSEGQVSAVMKAWDP